jgi:hypothetical protein
MVKLALELPAETITVAGTLATEVLLLVRVIEAPELGATPLRITVP